MFMDTPKLQPISKSRPKPSEQQQNVPSNSGSASSSSNNFNRYGNDNSAPTSSTSSSFKTAGGYGSATTTVNNTTINAVNKLSNPGATTNSTQQYDTNAPGAGDIRHNNNSYRKNNCSPNNFQKNFNNSRYPRDFQRKPNYYNHNATPYNRPHWEDTATNSGTTNHWKSNFKSNNNYRYRKINTYNNRLRENNTQFEYQQSYDSDVIVNNFETTPAGKFDTTVATATAATASVLTEEGLNNSKNNNTSATHSNKKQTAITHRGTKDQNRQPNCVERKLNNSNVKTTPKASPKTKSKQLKSSPGKKEETQEVSASICSDTTEAKKLQLKDQPIVHHKKPAKQKSQQARKSQADKVVKFANIKDKNLKASAYKTPKNSPKSKDISDPQPTTNVEPPAYKENSKHTAKCGPKAKRKLLGALKATTAASNTSLIEETLKDNESDEQNLIISGCLPSIYIVHNTTQSGDTFTKEISTTEPKSQEFAGKPTETLTAQSCTPAIDEEAEKAKTPPPIDKSDSFPNKIEPSGLESSSKITSTSVITENLAKHCGVKRSTSPSTCSSSEAHCPSSVQPDIEKPISSSLPENSHSSTPAAVSESAVKEIICENLQTSTTPPQDTAKPPENTKISFNSEPLHKPSNDFVPPGIDFILQHLTGVFTYPVNLQPEEIVTSTTLPSPTQSSSPVDSPIQEQEPQQQQSSVLNPKSSKEETVVESTQNSISPPPPVPATAAEEDLPLPKISLIPLSRLIAEEFWGTPNNISDNSHVTPTTTTTSCSSTANGPSSSFFDIATRIVAPPTTPQRHQFKPNLVKRKRNISTCSNTSTTSNSAQTADPIVDKLVTMNKINIKNIINSSETKYDEALKQQARKRLKEEIRRQLKSLNIEPAAHKDSRIIDFVPDEIVDCMNIPAIVLEEIRKVLGLVDDSEDFKSETVEEKESLELTTTNQAATLVPIEEVQETETATTNSAIEPANESITPISNTTMVNMNDLNGHHRSLDLHHTQETEAPTSSSSSTSCCPTNSRSVDPIAFTVKTELLEDKHKEAPSRRKHKKSHKSSQKQKTKTKSHNTNHQDVIVLDSSSGSSSSSSTSSSSSSSSSSTSSSDSESDTSKRSSSSAIRRKRLKLKVDAENVVDSFEKLIVPSLSDRLQERYHTKHSNSIHTKLHFISCICVSDYNSEKFSKMEIAKIQRNLKSTDSSMALEFLMREIVNVFNKQKQVAKMAGENRKGGTEKTIPTKATSVEHQQSGNACNGTGSLNVREKDLDNENTLQKCVSKVLSLYRQEMKAANQQADAAAAANTAVAVSSVEPTSVTMATAKPVQHCGNDLSTMTSATLAAYKNCNGLKYHKEEHSPQQQHINKMSQLQKETETQFNHIRSLMSSLSSPTDYSLLPVDSTSLRFNTGIFDFPTSSFNPQPHTFPALDLEILKKHSPIGEAVVNNLREIDLKLMELHKRKMFIEEMILKLQKDKMDTDLLTIKLQNEKFILLNTAMTVNVTSSGSSSNHGNTVIEKPVTTPDPNEDAVIFIKNIKTETVEIPDDDEQEQTPNPTPKAVQNGNNAEAVETQTETIRVTSNNSTQKEKPILQTQKQGVHEKNQESKTAGRKEHISSSTTSRGRAKRKGSAIETNRAKNPKISQTTSRNSTPEVHSSNDTQSVSKEKDKQKEKEIETERHTLQHKEDQQKITSSKSGCSKNSTPEPEIRNSPQNQQLTTEQAQHHQPTNSEQNNRLQTLSPPPVTPTKEPNTKPITTPVQNPAQEEEVEHGEIVESVNPDENDNSPDAVFSLKKMPSGFFKGIESPIAQVKLYENKILASAENGKIFLFDASTLEMENAYNKHTEAITHMYMCEEKELLFTTSLDGYFKKSFLKNLSNGTQSVYLKEPLQTLDIQWDIAYIGSRWGNIYTCNIMSNIRSATLLCSTESSIITIKAAKEGPRKVLIVTSKGNLLHVRDATSGLLLRTFDVPEFINVYSILLNEGTLYCGTQKKEIRKYDFVSGAPNGSITCGNGAVTILMFRNKFMFVGCYDGYIYILDKETGRQVSRLTGSGKMILTLEIVGDKIITSAKDSTMKVINIPTYCLGSSL